MSRLLSRSHTFAIIVILDLKIHQSMWIHWPFFPKTWTKGHWPLDDLWPHVCSHVWLYPRIIVSKSHDNTSMYVDSDQFCKIPQLPHTYTYYIHTHTTVQARQKAITYQWKLCPSESLHCKFWLPVEQRRKDISQSQQTANANGPPLKSAFPKEFWQETCPMSVYT